jgi:hypothetical protein
MTVETNGGRIENWISNIWKKRLVKETLHDASSEKSHKVGQTMDFLQGSSSVPPSR